MTATQQRARYYQAASPVYEGTRAHPNNQFLINEPRKSLGQNIHGNGPLSRGRVMQIDTNYFDHLALPSHESSGDNSSKAMPDLRNKKLPVNLMAQSHYEDNRISRHQQQPRYQQVELGRLEHITERQHDKSIGSKPFSRQSPSNVLEDTIAPVVPVDDFSSSFNSSRHDRRK